MFKKTILACLLLSLAYSINGCANAYAKLTSSNKQNLDDIINILEQGKWVFEDRSCSNSFLSLEFDKKKLEITVQSKLENSEDVNEYIYDILSVDRGRIYTSIRNEERLDNNGTPAKWHLILKNRQTFYWRRNDWGMNSGTKDMILCQ